MNARPREFARENPEILGQAVGEAKTGREILQILQASEFNLKPMTKAILEAVDVALEKGQAGFTVDGKSYLMLYKVTMLDGSGREWQARLKVVSPSDSTERVDSQLYDIGLSKGELASRMLMFAGSDERVEATGLILTNSKEEGKGLGLAMGLATNLMVRDVIRQRKFPQAKLFRVVIGDAARSQAGHDRNQWSGYVAKLIGFHELPEEEWELDNPEFERFFRV